MYSLSDIIYRIVLWTSTLLDISTKVVSRDSSSLILLLYPTGIQFRGGSIGALWFQNRSGSLILVVSSAPHVVGNVLHFGASQHFELRIINYNTLIMSATEVLCCFAHLGFSLFQRCAQKISSNVHKHHVEARPPAKQ